MRWEAGKIWLCLLFVCEWEQKSEAILIAWKQNSEQWMEWEAQRCLRCDQCVLHQAMLQHLVSCRVLYPPGADSSLVLVTVIHIGAKERDLQQCNWSLNYHLSRGEPCCILESVLWLPSGNLRELEWVSLHAATDPPWCFIGPQEPLTACKLKPAFVLLPVTTGIRQILVQRHVAATSSPFWTCTTHFLPVAMEMP